MFIGFVGLKGPGFISFHWTLSVERSMLEEKGPRVKGAEDSSEGRKDKGRELCRK